MKKLKESDIQKMILDYLRLKKIFCWKSNNGGVYIKKLDRYMRSPMPGVSDILGIYNGRFLAIEIKNKPNKPSEEQLEFIKKVNENEGLGFVAYSLEDVIIKLN